MKLVRVPFEQTTRVPNRHYVYVSPAQKALVLLIRAKLKPIAQFRTQSSRRLTVSHLKYMHQIRKIQMRELRAVFRLSICKRTFPCACSNCAQYALRQENR